jgi:TonB family protein
MLRHVIGFLTFALCFGAGWIFGAKATPEIRQVYQSSFPFPGQGSLSTSGGDRGLDPLNDSWAPPPKVTGLKILSKPKPQYTDEARNDNLEGTVLLRVTFLANGQIGSVLAVKGLPDGLTDCAITAARQLKFNPVKVNGTPQTVTKSLEYSFSLY